MLFKFTKLDELFILKSNFSCEVTDLIHIFICRNSARLEDSSVYIQHIWQSEYEKKEDGKKL